MRVTGSSAPLRTIVGAIGATLLASIGPLLVGANGTFITADLSAAETQIGIAIAGFFAASTALSYPGGLLAQKIGPRKAARIAALLSMISLLSVAFLVDGPLGLTYMMILAGCANGIAQPASNYALSLGVDASRQGLAFAFKQSAVPMSSALAGISVPAIALTLGWRWSFALAAAVGAVMAFILPHQVGGEHERGRSVRVDREQKLNLMLIAVAGTLGTIGTTSLGAFLVPSLIDQGISTSTSGLLLAIGSIGAIAARLTLGWTTDHRHVGAFRLTQLLTGLAAGCFLALAFLRSSVVLIIGSLGAVLGTSGWQGLYHQGVVRRYPRAAAVASGYSQSGAFLGGVLGPPIFSAIAGVGSNGLAWLFLAITGAASSAIFTSLSRDRR